MFQVGILLYFLLPNAKEPRLLSYLTHSCGGDDVDPYLSKRKKTRYTKPNFQMGSAILTPIPKILTLPIEPRQNCVVGNP